MNQDDFQLYPIGHLQSTLRELTDAPRQGDEGAPAAWLHLDPAYSAALHGIQVGDQLLLITWLHRADRNTLQVHPRSDPANPLTGVFSTRSPHRPNPLGLHRITVHEITGTRLRLGPIEAINGTPVVDLKPVLSPADN